MNNPANLKYSKDHEWVAMLDDNTALIGITDFAQGQLGDIVFVDIPTEGEKLGQNEVFGSIEAVKTVSDAFMPIGGEIIEFNGKLENDPALINKDPYGEGWIVKVAVNDPAELESLLGHAEYLEFVK